VALLTEYDDAIEFCHCLLSGLRHEGFKRSLSHQRTLINLDNVLYYQTLHRVRPESKSAFRVHFSYSARGMYSIRIMQDGEAKTSYI